MSRGASWWHFKRYCEGRRDRIGMNALWELSATKLPQVPKKGIVPAIAISCHQQNKESWLDDYSHFGTDTTAASAPPIAAPIVL